MASEITNSLVLRFRSWRLKQTRQPGTKAKKKSTAKPITARTVNKEVGTLSNMLNKGVEWGHLADNPIAGLKPLEHLEPAKERRSLTVDEVELLFAASPPALRLVWTCFMVTGMRRSELVELKFSDVDFDASIITVPVGLGRKKKKLRQIPIDAGLLAALTQLRDDATNREPDSRTPHVSAGIMYLSPSETRRDETTFSVHFMDAARKPGSPTDALAGPWTSTVYEFPSPR